MSEVFEFLFAVDIEVDLFAQPSIALFGVQILLKRVEIGCESDLFADGEFALIYAFYPHGVVFLNFSRQRDAPFFKHLRIILARIFCVAHAHDKLVCEHIAFILENDVRPTLVIIQLKVIAHQIARIDIQICGRDAVARKDFNLVRAAPEREQILLFDCQYVPVRTERGDVGIAGADVNQLAVDGDIIIVRIGRGVVSSRGIPNSYRDVAARSLVVSQTSSAAYRQHLRGGVRNEHELLNRRAVLEDQLHRNRLFLIMRERRRSDDDLVVVIRPIRFGALDEHGYGRRRDGYLHVLRVRYGIERDRRRRTVDAIHAKTLDCAVRQRDMIHRVLPRIERGKRRVIEHYAAVVISPLARPQNHVNRTCNLLGNALRVDRHPYLAAGKIIILKKRNYRHVSKRRRAADLPVYERLCLRIHAHDGD